MNRIDRDLYISDIQTVRERPTNRFDHVISVCQESVGDNVGCENSHFNMADGPESNDLYGGRYDYEIFEQAADAVAESVRGGNATLVHCHAGMSRSASVCIAAVGRLYGEPYSDAYDRVAAVRTIHPDGLLVDHAREYINE